MSNLTVTVNGETVKDVIGISYLEGTIKFRVVSKLDDKLISADYEADKIIIEITGTEIDYNNKR